MFRTSPGKIFLGLFAALLTACGGGDGDSSNPAPLPTPAAPAAGALGDGRLTELVEWARATQNVPAMGAIVIRHGAVVERAVSGRRSADGGPAVTVNDKWRLGSITKSMTSTIAASMVEEGLITWDTRPLDVWPELATDIRAEYRNVTLRNFLSHTSGMKRDEPWSGAEDSASGTPMQKRRAWAARMLAQAPEVSAGTMSYSNAGYVVAGAMLETRSGTPWETLLSNRVLVPLGMTHSGVGLPGTPGALDQPLGHYSRSSGFEPVPVSPLGTLPAALGPAGTAHTTLDDFVLYLQAHLAGERGVPSVVSAASFATLHTPVASGYALGWGRQDNAPILNATLWSHNGSDQRWFALTWFSPAADTALLIVTNSGGDRSQAAVDALDSLLRQRIAASP